MGGRTALERRRGEWRIALLLGVGVALFLLLFHRGHLSNSDEIGVFETTRSIALKGGIAIPKVANTVVGTGGARYSLYAIGQSLVALPFHELGRLAGSVLPEGAVRLLAGETLEQGGMRYGGTLEHFAMGLYGPFWTGVLVLLFFAFQRSLGASLRSALLASLMLGTCSYVALQSSYFLRHTSEAVALLAGFYLLFRWRKSGARHLLAGGTLLAASAILLRFPVIVAAPAFALYVVGVLRERRHAGVGPRELRRDLLAIALPVLAVLAVHMAVNQAKWGTLLAAPMLGTQESRFPYPIHYSGWGFLLSPGDSIFVYSPLLLLLPWTLPPFRRAHGLETAAFGVLFTTFLLFFSLYDGWTGFYSAPGPRYLFVPILLLMLPLGPWLDRIASRRTWLAVGALAALGAFVQVESMATSFGALAQEMRYPDYQPKWSFLFLPDVAPPVATAGFFLRGELNDMWIVRVAQGWKGQPGSPATAWLLAALWCAGLAACGLGLRRLYRRAVA